MIEQLVELIFPCNTTYRTVFVKAVVVALRMQISNRLSNTVEESNHSQSILEVWGRERQGSGFFQIRQVPKVGREKQI